MNIVAHDLRSPLNNVKGLTQILQYTELTKNQQIDVNRMNRTAQNGVDLITNLLDINNLEYSSKELSVAEVSLMDVMKKTYEAYSDDAKAKKIRKYRSWEMRKLGNVILFCLGLIARGRF